MMFRPILFQPDMVTAIIAGTKTQTRRICKNQPPDSIVECPYGVVFDRLWVKEKHCFLDVMKSSTPGNWYMDIEYSDGSQRQSVYIEGVKPQQTRERGEIGWRPSIHMPRWASRLTIEITDVRFEQLQKISNSDCIAEGIHPIGPEHATEIPREEYRALWERINGPGSWALNPWVWVLEFKKVVR